MNMIWEWLWMFKSRQLLFGLVLFQYSFLSAPTENRLCTAGHCLTPLSHRCLWLSSVLAHHHFLVNVIKLLWHFIPHFFFHLPHYLHWLLDVLLSCSCIHFLFNWPKKLTLWEVEILWPVVILRSSHELIRLLLLPDRLLFQRSILLTGSFFISFLF